MAKTFDEEQKRAIGTDSNTIVAAGAGSGKTTVLAGRYVRLITEGRARVENILTLTFTRKAAAEMYERIYSELKQLPDNPHAQAAVGEFEKASISTLDSFCTQIVRNRPQLFGLSSDFSIDPETTKMTAQQAALEYLVNNSNDALMVQLIEQHGFEKLWKEIFTPLAADHFGLADRLDPREDTRRQFQFLKTQVPRLLNDLTAVIRSIQEIPPVTAGIGNAHNALLGLEDRLIRQQEEKDWQAMLDTLLTVKMENRGGGKKPEILEFKEHYNNYGSVEKSLKTALTWLLLETEQLKAAEHLHNFRLIIQEQRRIAGILTFQDIMDLTIKILTADRELRQFYKEKFSFIMIDEFQDNNSQQKDLLYLLAEKQDRFTEGIPEPSALDPGKLFFVGDEKQSIYLFRGADVSVFKNLNKEIAASDGQALALNTNYRSEPGLIHFFNKVFPVIMADAAEDYEAEFRPLGYRDPTPGIESRIGLFFKPYLEEAGANEMTSADAEAFHIARFVKDAVANRSLLIPGDEGNRPAVYSDFALLMRSTSNQIRYERIFRQLGIPYSTMSVRALFMEAPVCDFYNFLQLALYPEDKKAYTAYLRSPLVQLSDDLIFQILQTGDKPLQTDISLMRGYSADEQQKYDKAGREYKKVLELTAAAALGDLVDFFWYDCGYRYFLLQTAANHAYLEYHDYLKMMADVYENRGNNLARFLDHIRENLGQYERQEELEILKESTGGVEIMTLHGSKGLEFPVVIIADMGNTGKNADDRAWFYSPEFGITLDWYGGGSNDRDRLNYFREKEKEEIQKREAAELKRLLYVGMTRAKSHLFFSGYHHRQNRSNLKSLLNLTLLGLGSAPGENPLENPGLHDMVTEIQNVNRSRLNQETGYYRKTTLETLQPCYDAIKPPEKPLPLPEFTATELEQALGGKTGTDGKDQGAIGIDPLLADASLETDFGTLCHWLTDFHLTHPEAAAGDIVYPEYLLMPFPPAQQAMVLQTAQNLVNNILSDQRFRTLTESGKPASELKFILRKEGCLITGIMDLLIRTGTKTLVVDFKTDRFYHAGEHAVQLAIYREAAEELTGCPAETYLLFFRSGELLFIPEEEETRNALISHLQACQESLPVTSM